MAKFRIPGPLRAHEGAIAWIPGPLCPFTQPRQSWGDWDHEAYQRDLATYLEKVERGRMMAGDYYAYRLNFGDEAAEMFGLARMNPVVRYSLLSSHEAYERLLGVTPPGWSGFSSPADRFLDAYRPTWNDERYFRGKRKAPGKPSEREGPAFRADPTWMTLSQKQRDDIIFDDPRRRSQTDKELLKQIAKDCDLPVDIHELPGDLLRIAAGLGGVIDAYRTADEEARKLARLERELSAPPDPYQPLPSSAAEAGVGIGEFLKEAIAKRQEKDQRLQEPSSQRPSAGQGPDPARRQELERLIRAQRQLVKGLRQRAQQAAELAKGRYPFSSRQRSSGRK